MSTNIQYLFLLHIIGPQSTWSPIKVLAPLQKVETTLTRHCEYTLDPFCTSHNDFQLRAEDELAKFLFHSLDNAWRNRQYQNNFQRQNPVTKKPMTIKEAQQGPARQVALDLRWQLKHLLFYHNRTVFVKVFAGRISMSNQNRMSGLLKRIKKQANQLAHKQYLQDDTRKKAESKTIPTLIDEMIDLVDIIYNMTKHVREIEPVSVLT